MAYTVCRNEGRCMYFEEGCVYAAEEMIMYHRKSKMDVEDVLVLGRIRHARRKLRWRGRHGRLS